MPTNLQGTGCSAMATAAEYGGESGFTVTEGGDGMATLERCPCPRVSGPWTAGAWLNAVMTAAAVDEAANRRHSDMVERISGKRAEGIRHAPGGRLQREDQQPRGADVAADASRGRRVSRGRHKDLPGGRIHSDRMGVVPARHHPRATFLVPASTTVSTGVTHGVPAGQLAPEDLPPCVRRLAAL